MDYKVSFRTVKTSNVSDGTLKNRLMKGMGTRMKDVRYNAEIRHQKVPSGEDLSSEPEQARKGKLIFWSNLSSQITCRNNYSCSKA